MLPAAIGIRLCIGSLHAWSIFNPALTKVRDVAAPGADDRTLGEMVWIFSVAILFLGLAAAFADGWLEDVGPRIVGIIAAGCRGGGYFRIPAPGWKPRGWTPPPDEAAAGRGRRRTRPPPGR